MSHFFHVLRCIHYFHWQDGVEIIIFSALFYVLAQWLKRDKHNNLLQYFYGYCLFALGSYVFNLSTVTTFLFYLPQSL